MGKVYVGDVGTLFRLNAGQDLSGASSLSIKYQKPSGTTGSWTATANGNYGQYSTQVGDLDESGRWRFHLYVNNLTGWTGHGEMVSLEVYSMWEG